MTSSCSDFSTLEGDIIVVDPEQREAVSVGDFVVAKVGEQNALTFRQLADDAGKPVLKPLNK